MRFLSPLRCPVENYLSGRSYEMVRACDLSEESSSLARIVSICNETKVYEWLFRGPLGGRPYEEANARDWLKWSREGWLSGTHFVFAVIDDQKCVVAACDIKSNDPVAEIGYWASQRERGIMTNTVMAMCALAADAGFRELFARTKKENYKSQAVLRRAGFDRSLSDDNGDARFTLLLGAKAKEETEPDTSG